MRFCKIVTRLTVILCVLWMVADLQEALAATTIRKRKLRLRRVAKKPQGNVKLRASFIIVPPKRTSSFNRREDKFASMSPWLSHGRYSGTLESGNPSANSKDWLRRSSDIDAMGMMSSLLSHLAPIINPQSSTNQLSTTSGASSSWPPNDLALKSFATKPTLNYQSDVTTYVPGHFNTIQPSLYNPGFYRYL